MSVNLKKRQDAGIRLSELAEIFTCTEAETSP